MEIMNKIEIRNKADAKDKISVGANTEVLINGQKAKDVKSVKYEIDSRSVGVVTIEYYGDVEINSNVPEIVVKAVSAKEPLVQEVGKFSQTHIDQDED